MDKQLSNQCMLFLWKVKMQLSFLSFKYQNVSEYKYAYRKLNYNDFEDGYIRDNTNKNNAENHMQKKDKLSTKSNFPSIKSIQQFFCGLAETKSLSP